MMGASLAIIFGLRHESISVRSNKSILLLIGFKAIGLFFVVTGVIMIPFVLRIIWYEKSLISIKMIIAACVIIYAGVWFLRQLAKAKKIHKPTGNHERGGS
jgi:hypothetical protein